LAQLLHDIAHGDGGNVERAADLLVGVTKGEQLEHLLLPGLEQQVLSRQQQRWVLRGGRPPAAGADQHRHGVSFSSLGPAWTFPLQFLGGQAAAGGIAAINAFGNIGGFLAPFVMGRLMLRPHGDSLVLAYLAEVLLLSALLALLVNRRGVMSGAVSSEPVH
jgi:hypothetical protein